MNNYEAVIMFYPDVEEEKRVATFDRIKNAVEADGKVTNVDEWGMRKLAYEIEYYNEAYYILYEFEADPKVVKELNRLAKIMDPVMRQMVIKKED